MMTTTNQDFYSVDVPFFNKSPVGAGEFQFCVVESRTKHTDNEGNPLFNPITFFEHVLDNQQNHKLPTHVEKVIRSYVETHKHIENYLWLPESDFVKFMNSFK